MTNDLTAGMHLILIPSGEFRLPKDLLDSLSKVAEHTLKGRNATLHATAVQHDHVHILISVATVKNLHELIDALVSNLQQAVITSDAAMKRFTWENGVHVTLLPPWHIEIMASFVRDQDRYHGSRTLEQELEQVFRPNAVSLDEDDEEFEEESALCVN